MTWLSHHRESMRLADEAKTALRLGHRGQSEAFYAQAAEAEVQAVQSLDTAKTRTFGVTAMSVVCLYFKAGELLKGEAMAYGYLASGLLPEFAAGQIRDLLQEDCLH